MTSNPLYGSYNQRDGSRLLRLSGNDARSLEIIEALLRDEITVRVRVTGDSMKPFIRSNDRVHIAPGADAGFRIGSLLFFKDPLERPVLHRLIKIQRHPDSGIILQTRGDALVMPDRPIPARAVLGQAVRLERHIAGKGRRVIELQSRKWRLVGAAIARSHPVWGFGLRFRRRFTGV